MRVAVTPTEVERVYRALDRGECRAIARSAIVQATELSDRRVRAAIHALITERHVPVCSSPNGGGYYIAATPDELARAVRYLRSYGAQAMERASSLEAAFALFEVEQMVLGVG